MPQALEPDAVRALLHKHLADTTETKLLNDRLIVEITQRMERLRLTQEAVDARTERSKRDRRRKVFAEAAQHAQEMRQLMLDTGLWTAEHTAAMEELARLADFARALVPNPSDLAGAVPLASSSGDTSHANKVGHDPVLALARMFRSFTGPSNGKASAMVKLLHEALPLVGVSHMTADSIAQHLRRAG